MLRDVSLLGWNGPTLALAGVEKIHDDKLSRLQRFAQT